MTDYTKTTNFTAKDALSTGNPNKVIRGSEFDTEFDAIQSAVATKANSTSPTITTPTLTSPTVTGSANFVSARFSSEYDNGNSSTSKTIDWTQGNKQKLTLTGACTVSFTAPAGPTSLTLKLIQDATGSRTVTWPAAVKWPSGTAPTLTTDASAVDIVVLYYDGTNYFGNVALDFS